MVIENWGSVTLSALQDLWQAFLSFIPNLIGALIVFIIGWFISVWIGKLVTEILKRLKFNQLFERGNWDEALAKANIKVDASVFLGAIVKWIMVIVFLIATVDILGMTQFASLLQSILGYLPHVFVAALIFVVTVIVSDIVEKIVRAAVERLKVGYGNLVSAIVKWSIWIFSALLILRELIIVPDLVTTLFKALIYGIVALLVISFGLAFGLGGRETAGKIIEDVRDDLKQK
jgi:hypothetical protein